jgi:F0F1-type ATP synthase assembly protein I
MTASVQPDNPPPRRYRWPWFVLAFFLLGVTLTVIAVRREVQRVKEQREPWLQESSNPTNAGR